MINRSNSLSGWNYGRNFLYTERMMAPSMIVAILQSLSLAIGGLFLIFPPTRWLAKKFVIPKPGQGPNAKLQEEGFFKMKFWGKGIVSARLDFL